MDEYSKNLGSIIELKYALLSDIYSISVANDQHQVNVTFNPDTDFTDILFQPESAKFIETGIMSEAGIRYDQELVYSFLKISSSSMVQHMYLTNKPLILLVTDANNNQYIFGSKENPLYLTYKIIRPEKADQPTKYKITFKHQSDHPCYFYPRTGDPNSGVVIPDEPVDTQ